MDGIAVNKGVDYAYLKDATGVERIGAFSIIDDGGVFKTPLVTLDDITSGKRLNFRGDYILPNNHPGRFSWFPSIQEAGVLHDWLENNPNKRGDLHKYDGFIFGGLLLEVAKKEGVIGEESKKRLESELDLPATVYGNSLELLYANLNGNRDVIWSRLNHIYSDMAKVKTLEDEKIQITGTLDEFLEANPKLVEHLTDAELAVHGTPYDTPEKILQVLRSGLPTEILEAGYQQFIAMREAKKRLAEVKAANPIEQLKELVKNGVDVKDVVYIDSTNPSQDLRRIE